MSSGVRAWLAEQVQSVAEEKGLVWFEKTCAEVSGGVSETRFAGLISMASRFARRKPIGVSGSALAQASALVTGWNPERWTALDLLRVGLVLARQDLEEDSGPRAILSAIRCADVGELCALYRSMAFVPRPEDYLWQAGEGCRSNMNDVFEAMACDHPFPAAHFDEVAWRALVIKAVFIGAPLWRVHGLDARLSEELALVALDLADERRSAGRDVAPELWMCLGAHGGARALESLELEAAAPRPESRRAAVLGLARAGQSDRLDSLRSNERDATVLATIERAQTGHSTQSEFRPLQLFAR